METGTIVSKVITDNAGEKIEVSWDGVRFGISRSRFHSTEMITIVLNPIEMYELVKFGGSVGKE